jgi:hypothetical protein
MLSATCEPNVSEIRSTAQIETLPSDAEVSRRVYLIRSQWSESERQHRRVMADERFADLILRLMGAEAAA